MASIRLLCAVLVVFCHLDVIFGMYYPVPPPKQPMMKPMMQPVYRPVMQAAKPPARHPPRMQSAPQPPAGYRPMMQAVKQPSYPPPMPPMKQPSYPPPMPPMKQPVKQPAKKPAKSKGRWCYSCSYSPPKSKYGGYHKPAVGGWDKCLPAFSHYSAKHHGIDVWDCHSNCYVRTDPNGDVFRGCYKGEFGVNPNAIGCFTQAKSHWCFCEGNACNNGAAPHKPPKSPAH